MGRSGAEGDNYETKAEGVIYAYEEEEESTRKRENQELTDCPGGFIQWSLLKGEKTRRRGASILKKATTKRSQVLAVSDAASRLHADIIGRSLPWQ